MRAALPPSVYLWLTACHQVTDDDCDAGDVAQFSRVDPWFGANPAPVPSLGAGCRTGDTVSAWTAAAGCAAAMSFRDAARQPVRRLVRAAARAGSVPESASDCFIGCIHRTGPDVVDAFVGGALERIPRGERAEPVPGIPSRPWMPAVARQGPVDGAAKRR